MNHSKHVVTLNLFTTFRNMCPIEDFEFFDFEYK